MRPKQIPISKLQGKSYLAVLAMSFLVMIFFAGCNSESPTNTQPGNQPNKTVQTQQSPTPVPSPSGSPTIQPTDEPIIIKGGSAEIEHNDNPAVWIPDNAASPTQFACRNCQIDQPVSIQPLDNNGNPTGSPSTCRIANYTNCKVIIQIKQPGGVRKDVEITGTANGVTLKYEYGEYPRDSANPKKHKNPHNKVEEVNVDGTNCPDVPRNGKVLVTVHTTNH